MTASLSERLVERVAATLERTRTDRRSVLVKSAVVGSAGCRPARPPAETGNRLRLGVR